MVWETIRLAAGFTVASKTPSLKTIPKQVVPLFTASLAYSTWNKRPSGEIPR